MPNGSRILDHKDNKNLGMRIYLELKRAIDDYCDREQWRRRMHGEHVEPGELRGHSHMVNRLLCWWMTLDVADRRRIDREGAVLLDQLHSRPQDYAGDLELPVRKESVFRQDPEAGSDGRAA